jgi:hypothetical protein
LFNFESKQELAMLIKTAFINMSDFYKSIYWECHI